MEKTERKWKNAKLDFNDTNFKKMTITNTVGYSWYQNSNATFAHHVVSNVEFIPLIRICYFSGIEPEEKVLWLKIERQLPLFSFSTPFCHSRFHNCEHLEWCSPNFIGWLSDMFVIRYKLLRMMFYSSIELMGATKSSE